jgi:hypothetical protein
LTGARLERDELERSSASLWLFAGQQSFLTAGDGVGDRGRQASISARQPK